MSHHQRQSDSTDSLHAAGQPNEHYWKMMLKEAQERIQILMQEKEEQDAKHRETQCRLREMEATYTEMQGMLQDGEKNNEVRFYRLLGRNRQILKESREEEMKHLQVQNRLNDLEMMYKGIQGKLEYSEKKNEELQRNLDEALQRNGELFQEKKELGAKHMELQWKLHEAYEENKILQIGLVGTAKPAEMQKEEEEEEDQHPELQHKVHEMEASLTEMHCQLEDSLKTNEGLRIMLDGQLLKNAELHQRNTELNEALQLKVKAQKAVYEAEKVWEEKHQELEEKQAERQEKIEELKRRITELEEQNAENLSDLKKVILQHKALQERCLRKKKLFRFPWHQSAASSVPPGWH